MYGPRGRPRTNHARMRALRKATAEDRITRIARNTLESQVNLARRTGLTDKQIGIAILRGALGNPTGDPEEGEDAAA